MVAARSEAGGFTNLIARLSQLNFYCGDRGDEIQLTRVDVRDDQVAINGPCDSEMQSDVWWLGAPCGAVYDGRWRAPGKDGDGVELELAVGPSIGDCVLGVLL